MITRNIRLTAIVLSLLISIVSLKSQTLIQTTRDCTFSEQLAAKEIRKYIYQRTDTLLEIIESNYLPDKGDVILLAQDGHPLVKQLQKEIRETASRGEFIIKTIQDNNRDVLVISGFDYQAVLYGAYRFAEHLGVRYDLSGDIIPDEKIALDISGFDEMAKTLLETRGIQPFHDFYSGPDFWSTTDYISIISQLPKLGMNFIGLHTYPTWSTTEENKQDVRQGPEPTVWIGLEEDINKDGSVNWSYPAFYAHTHRPFRIWGNDTLGTGFFHAGADQLFEKEQFGSEVFDESIPDDLQSSNAVFNKTGKMFDIAFTHARNLNVKTCIGTELPLGLEPKGNAVLYNWLRVMPPGLQNRLEMMDKDPVDPNVIKEVYRGIFTRIMKTHPLDYYWLWSWEVWSMHDPVTRKHIEAFKHDITIAHDALQELGNPFQLGLAGWILGTDENPAEFDNILPPSAPFFGLWDEASGFEYLSSNRVKWPATWLEEDWGIIQPQLELHRIYNDIKAAVDKDCNGMIAKHWRTRVMGGNTGSMKDLLWTYTKTRSEFSDEFPESRMNWIDDFYIDWATHMFGPEAGDSIAMIFASLDKSGEPGEPGAVPHVSGWDTELDDGNGAPGAIEANDESWTSIKHRYDFVGNLESLRSKIKGKGNLERFDYWLKTMQILKLMGEYGCVRFQFEQAMEEEQWTEALEHRRSLARLFEKIMTLEIEKATNVTDYGEIINLEILNWQQLIVQKWDETLIEGLGNDLPADANPSKEYSGQASIKVTTRQTQIYLGSSLNLRVVIVGNHCQPVLKWRSLGSENYQTVPLDHIAKGVYNVTISDPEADFEYYIVADSGSETLFYPASAPEINHAVIVQAK